MTDLSELTEPAVPEFLCQGKSFGQELAAALSNGNLQPGESERSSRVA